MGMFDKDKEYGNRLDEEFNLREKFILWDAVITGDTISTSMGDAEVVRLTVSRMETPDDKYDCTTVASSIVDKARDAGDDDFPAVVELRKVESKKFKTQALVLQFVREYDGAVAAQ